MRRLLVVAVSIVALGGCVALFDFGAYDTSRPEAAALDATEDAAAFEPFGISLGSAAQSGVSGEPVTLEVTVQRRGVADVIVLGLAGASDVALAAAPIPLGTDKVSVTITPGTRHGLASLSLTATAASYPGFTASAPFTLDVRGKPGTLDTSFANDGVFAPAFDLSARDVAVLPDNRIVVAGGSGSQDGVLDVIRLLPEGVLDPTFGTGGRTRAVEPTTGGEGATGVALRPDGTALVVGNRVVPGGVDVVVVAALDGRGVKDPTFGDAGVVVLDSLGSAGSASIALVPGSGFVATNGNFIAGRLSRGEPALAFGDAGTVYRDNERFSGAALDLTGGAVIGGVSTAKLTGPLIALSLDANGSVRGYFKEELEQFCMSARPIRLASGPVVLVATCSVDVGAAPSPALVAVAVDAGVVPSFGAAGIARENEAVSRITGVAVDGGLATVKLHDLDTAGAPNPRLVLTTFNENGVLRWTTAKTMFPALTGMTQFAAATDHANRVVIVGTKGPRPIVARFWL